jgi:hypothetical protein
MLLLENQQTFPSNLNLAQKQVSIYNNLILYQEIDLLPQMSAVDNCSHSEIYRDRNGYQDRST